MTEDSPISPDIDPAQISLDEIERAKAQFVRDCPEGLKPILGAEAE